MSPRSFTPVAAALLLAFGAYANLEAQPATAFWPLPVELRYEGPERAELWATLVWGATFEGVSLTSRSTATGGDSLLVGVVSITQNALGGMAVSFAFEGAMSRRVRCNGAGSATAPGGKQFIAGALISWSMQRLIR
ncbi:MAG: hypothetical protein IT361_05490 [Gemmatimonadaceae bacterium]|nr:hypothetical protein [Gemmatimonadaceae bacterium]